MYKSLIYIIAIHLIVISCRKDKTSPYTETIADPTPYILDLPDWIVGAPFGRPMPIPVDNPLTVEGIALGRELFYEPQLSGNNSMSCGSCHFQKYGFSDPSLFSQGIDGDLGDRQAMAIVNLGWDKTFFWDGRAVSLEEQAYGPVTNPVELNETWPNVVSKLQADPKYPVLFEKAFGTKIIDSILVVKAIAQFERTLVSFDSRFEQSLDDESLLSASEQNGRLLFYGIAQCGLCHKGLFMTDTVFRNNGLDSYFTDLGLGGITGISADNGKFKVATLKNIALTAPYMHDGRFETLMEVIEHYNSGVAADSPNLDPLMSPSIGGLGLTSEQKNNLLNFLKTLTDYSFIANPSFSNPN